MVEMGGLFNTIIESITARQVKNLLKQPSHFHDKMTSCTVKMMQYIFCLTSERFSVFQGYRLTRLGLLLSVGLELGINHDSFEHHIEA